MNRLKLFLIKKIFHFYRKKEADKIVFLLNNPCKHSELITKLIKEYTFRLTICFTENTQEEAMRYKEMGAKIVSLNQTFFFYTKVLHLLASAKIIITDDCFAFLDLLEFSEETRIIQLWHTTGVIKKIKQETMNINNHVYTDFVVGSQKMSQIFQHTFQAQEKQIKKMGIPSTDIFFTDNFFAKARREFKETFSELADKKIILYAPTRRDKSINQFALGFKQIDEMLTDQSYLLVKPHPFEKKLIDTFGQFAHISANLKTLSLEKLLVNVDILITDYSSIIFDYVLANPKGEIIFYNYDLERYQETIGLNAEFLEKLPGEMVTTQGELMNSLEEKISQEQTDINPLFVDLNKKWNEKNDGKATERFLELLTKIESGIEENNNEEESGKGK